MLKSVQQFFDSRKLSTSGNAFMINYGNVNDSLVKIACGFPIKEPTWVWKTLNLYKFPASGVVTIQHFGYPTDKARRAVQKYCVANGLVINGAFWEEYLYNPETSNDTLSWETKIYCPVK
jgi:effector-binding domain-containing protein